MPFENRADDFPLYADTPAMDDPDFGVSTPLGLIQVFLDDNRDFATSLAALLEEFGHETFVAHDGEAGVALAAERLPDVVLLDIGLPRMDGYEVARRLRASPALGGVTLVALSGYSQEEDKRLGREAGFDHYLVKPIDAAELVNILDALPVGA